MRKLTEEDTDLGTLIEIDEFVGMCVSGEIEDSDGYGRLVYDCDEVDEKKEIAPSELIDNAKVLSDDDLTHVLWFEC